MDNLIGLAVLLIVGIPIAAIAALVMVMGLRTRVTVLESEVARLSGLAPAAASPAADAATRADTDEAGPTDRDLATGPAEAVVPPPLPMPAAPQTIAARSGEEAEAEATSSALPPPPPLPPAPPASLEERIGTRWAVWVGGLALAFGLVFLVQYSIEMGFFGPAARLAMGAALSLLAIGAGEWLRRGDRAAGILAGFPTAHVPGILAAAGATGLFADVWAAHAVYGYLGSATAFVALGLVAVTTIAAALVHGPWLGVLGILGAYGAPLLVSSTKPEPLALAAFLLVVTSAGFAVARIRLWRWVAATALVLALIWGLVLVDLFPPHAFSQVPTVIYALGLLGLVAGILIVSLDDVWPIAVDVPLDRFGLAALTGTTALALVVFDSGSGALAPVLLIATLVGLVGLAWMVPAVAPAVVIAGVAAVAAAAVQGLDVARSLAEDTFAIGADGLVALRPRVVASFLTLHGAIGLGLIAAGALGAWRATPKADRASGWFALAGTGFPLLLLVVVWGRVAGFESHYGFAAFALVLALGFAGACARLIGRESPDAPSLAVATYAVGAVAALGTAAAIGLDHAALTVALALMIPAIAWVWRLRPIGALRIATAIAGLVVLGRLGWDPAIVRDIGTTPIFNALLLGYGVPAAGALYAAWVFRVTATDLWRAIVEGLALIFTGLLVLIEIRHLTHGGDLYAPTIGLVELGLDVTTAFLLSAGAQRAAGRLGSRVVEWASIGLSLLTSALALAGLLVLENPVLTGRPVGPLVFGALFFGYGLPAMAAAVTARMARNAGRPGWFVATLAGTAYVLGFAWATLLVRRAFQGEVLTGYERDAEMWAYSAVWLAYGVATLVAGLWLASKPVRLLSAVVVTLTAAKVFLLDLSDVGGVWRAFSFIGLGLVLIGIALVYQRFLFGARKAP